MTIKTARTEVDGRAYEVSFDNAKKNEPLFVSLKVTRVRKDGKLGRVLWANHKAAWTAFQQVRDEVVEG